MLLEWDEIKRQQVYEERGIDFARLTAFFDRERYERSSIYNGERRFVSTGWYEGVVVTIVYTHRGEKRRVITARKARNYEREAFFDRFGHRS